LLNAFNKRNKKKEKKKNSRY